MMVIHFESSQTSFADIQMRKNSLPVADAPPLAIREVQYSQLLSAGIVALHL